MAIGLGGLALVVGARAGDSRQSSVTIDAPAEAGDVSTADGSTGGSTAEGAAVPDGQPGLVGADQIRRLDFGEIDQPGDVCAQGLDPESGTSLEMITLSGGQSDIINEDMFSQLAVDEDAIAYGDITGDGVEEAVVHTVCEFGANGRQHTLEVWDVADGLPRVVATVPAPGEDVTGPLPPDVQSFDIGDGALEVVWTGYAEDDPNCCPSLVVTQRYQLMADELQVVGEPEVGEAQ